MHFTLTGDVLQCHHTYTGRLQFMEYVNKDQQIRCPPVPLECRRPVYLLPHRWSVHFNFVRNGRLHANNTTDIVPKVPTHGRLWLLIVKVQNSNSIQMYNVSVWLPQGRTEHLSVSSEISCIFSYHRKKKDIAMSIFSNIVQPYREARILNTFILLWFSSLTRKSWNCCGHTVEKMHNFVHF